MATYRINDREKEIDKRTKEIIDKYKNAGWSTPVQPRNTTTIKPTSPLSVRDVLISNTPMDTVFQALVKGITKLVGLISSFSEKTATVKEYTPPPIHDEAVKVKIKKPIAKLEPVVEDFKTKGTFTGRDVDLVSEWDNMYAQRQQDSIHGRLNKSEKSSAPIDSREGRIGWLNAYNATHANDFDSDPLIPKRKTLNAITFKLKDRAGSIPTSTEMVFLGNSRVDGCGIYRYYGQDIDAIKQHYNIEELYE